MNNSSHSTTAVASQETETQHLNQVAKAWAQTAQHPEDQAALNAAGLALQGLSSRSFPWCGDKGRLQTALIITLHELLPGNVELKHAVTANDLDEIGRRILSALMKAFQIAGCRLKAASARHARLQKRLSEDPLALEILHNGSEAEGACAPTLPSDTRLRLVQSAIARARKAGRIRNKDASTLQRLLAGERATDLARQAGMSVSAVSHSCRRAILAIRPWLDRIEPMDLPFDPTVPRPAATEQEIPGRLEP